MNIQFDFIESLLNIIYKLDLSNDDVHLVPDNCGAWYLKWDHKPNRKGYDDKNN